MNLNKTLKGLVEILRLIVNEIPLDNRRLTEIIYDFISEINTYLWLESEAKDDH